MKVIEYQIPRLGKLTANLYPTAQIAYQLLDIGKHIERMKHNPQLGIIRSVYEGAHHTRWEYVVTQLYIVDHLNRFGPKGIGLSNNTPKIRGKNISGADILQVWVLLLNAGHLLGTFATERALLNSLKKDKYLRRKFKTGLPNDEEIRNLFDNILENEDIYRVHELIAFFFLERLKRKHKSEAKLLVDVLKLFKFDPPQGIERRRKLKILFRRIRQVSYLFLDSHYGPIPLVFELGPLLFDFEEHAKELFLAEESPLTKALDSFQDLLSENLYLAPKSMYAYGRQARYVEEIIKKEGQKLYSIKTLYDFLRDQKNLLIKYWPKNSEYLLRFWFDERESPLPVTKSIKPLELEKEWNSCLPNSRCICTIERDPKQMMMGITLAFNENINFNNMPRLLSQIMQRLIAFQDLYRKRLKIRGRDPHRKIFKAPCRELLLFILKQLWGKNITFTPNSHTLYQDYWVIERGSTKSAKFLRELCKWYEIRGMDPDRLHEIKTLAMALEDINHRGTVLLTTSQIIVRQTEDNTDITDLDGIAICSDSSELSLLLVESKNTRRRNVAKARERLSKIIQVMKFPVGKEPSIKELKGFGAYSRLFLYTG